MKFTAFLFFVFLGFARAAYANEISFSEALHIMVEKNVDVQVQETSYRAASATVSAAKGAFSPQLNLQAQSLNYGGAQVSYSGSGGPSSQALSANATWNLFRSGADVAALRSATASQESQGAALEDTYLKAEDKAAQSLLNFIESKLAVEAYARSEMSSQHFLEIAEQRFNKSLLSREEMDKVATDAANAQARRADAEIIFNSAQQIVEAQLGHANVQTKWPWDSELQPAHVKELLQDNETALKTNRPDLRAARAALNAEDLHSRQLWRGLLPTIDMTFSALELRSNGLSQDGWSSVATLTIPLWSGLHDYSAYRIQIESKNAAEARLRQIELNIDSLAKLAQDNYRLAFDQYTRRKKNLERAQHILQQDDARFKVGRSDANELNLDLARVTEAEILTVQGIQQVHASYVQLYHAFGLRLP